MLPVSLRITGKASQSTNWYAERLLRALGPLLAVGASATTRVQTVLELVAALL